MRVLMLTRYGRMGASSRVRSLQYVPFLSSRNFQISVSPLLPEAYLERLYAGEGRSRWIVLKAYWRRVLQLTGSSRYDLVWIEKELFPFLPAWGERMLRLLKTPDAVDYEDAVFNTYDTHQSAMVSR